MDWNCSRPWMAPQPWGWNPRRIVDYDLLGIGHERPIASTRTLTSAELSLNNTSDGVS